MWSLNIYIWHDEMHARQPTGWAVLLDAFRFVPVFGHFEWRQLTPISKTIADSDKTFRFTSLRLPFSRNGNEFNSFDCFILNSFTIMSWWVVPTPPHRSLIRSCTKCSSSLRILWRRNPVSGISSRSLRRWRRQRARWSPSREYVVHLNWCLQFLKE